MGIAILIALLSTPALAEPLVRNEVPAPLAPWVDWVLAGTAEKTCPFLHGDAARRTCVWPGALALSLDDQGGRFSQDAESWADGWLALPGDAKHWPQDVTVDGKSAIVVERDGAPAVELGPGLHTVSGAFRWAALPEILPAPAATGLVELSLRGTRVGLPNRDEEGRLWVHKASALGETKLDVIVHRHVDDGIPLILTTQVELKVSGESREVVLGRALPEGFVAMSVGGALPARLDPDARLRVQVRPGTFSLTLIARHDGPTDAITLAAADGPWDDDEAWVFAAHPELREVAVEGVTAIDPQQTQLPEGWKGLPAFLVKPGDTVRFNQRRRGDEDPAPDRLSLDRTLWLDFDGGGYSVKDVITGTFHRSWRLSMAEETSLGRVAIGLGGGDAGGGSNGSGEAPAARGSVEQFINTMSPPGVEIRVADARLDADSRIEGARFDIPAVSWMHDFESVQGRLNLPPGWRLLHALGVDDATPTWWTRWNLLDQFLVLITALSIGKLWGGRWGLFALVTLALSWHEGFAPRWTWLVLLASEALARAIPAGAVQRVTAVFRGVVRVVLVVLVIPFVVFEVRQAIYPQLEQPGSEDGGFFGGLGGKAQEATAPGNAGWEGRERPQAAEFLHAEDASSRDSNSRGDHLWSRKSSISKLGNVYAPDVQSQVTTGPGLPTWSWRTVRLTWSGPVDADQRLRLFLSPPWLTSLLGFVASALVAVLALRLVGLPITSWVGRMGAGRAGTATIMLLALGAPFRDAHGQDVTEPPAPAILDELRARLTEAPACAPDCAESARLTLFASGTTLRMRVEVAAEAATAVPLPGGAQQWTPERVLLDGATAKGLLRTADGNLWIPLSRGAHQLVLEGTLGKRESVQIPLPLKPHRVEASLDGWTLDGVYDDGSAEDTLLLLRSESAATEAGAPSEALAPFVQVTREIALGLSWQVTTTVERLTPLGAAVLVEVPLLPGESVTTADLRVVNGTALISMGPNAAGASWTSTLASTDRIVLTAPNGVAWVESWVVDSSPMWHVEPTGIPPVHDAATGPRVRTWRPWPGETVELAVSRPAGAPGQTTTVDSSTLVVRPGLRSTDATLDFHFRSSRGGQHALTLPEGVEVQSISVDGVARPVRVEGRVVTVPVAPGSHSVGLTWRQPGGIGLAWHTPEVDLGLASVNSVVRVEMPRDRWTLWLSGPRLGPAVLFWSLLAVYLACSVLLSRMSWTPLRTRHWFLLLLGLTQVPVIVAGIVVAWIVGLGWRKERPRASNTRFNLVQLGLPVLTLVALACLCGSIAAGLLGAPEMQISGNDSTAGALVWYLDKSARVLPQAMVISVPRAVYRYAMLAWALWLAVSLVGWLRWAWASYTAGGMWRAHVPAPPAA